MTYYQLHLKCHFDILLKMLFIENHLWENKHKLFLSKFQLKTMVMRNMFVLGYRDFKNKKYFIGKMLLEESLQKFAQIDI